MRYLNGYHPYRIMENLTALSGLVHKLRLGAGLSQRELAKRAGTSQPAIARYERGVATPSWTTVERLAVACGRSLRIGVEMVPDPADVELAERLLELSPEGRLHALARYARLREAVREQV
jgi:transcriptional regulator with XRE-family HTH domain